MRVCSRWRPLALGNCTFSRTHPCSILLLMAVHPLVRLIPRPPVPYPGSKHALLPAIFGLVSEAAPGQHWRDLTFADAFVGAGAVSIAAKRLGFGQVLSNDISPRSATVARAVIENSIDRLSTFTAMRLFEPAVGEGTPEVASHLPLPVSSFFTNASRLLANNTFRGVEHDLVCTLLIRQLIRCFPMGLPSASDGTLIASEDYDRVTASRLRHYILQAPVLTTPSGIREAVSAVNAAIVPGAAVVTELDVFEWLPTINADIVYLDPPYAGTMAYERTFALVDEFIGASPQPTSSFSRTSPPLDELFDACRHVPIVVLSMGNAVLNEEALRATVARHRRVRRFLSLPYRHLSAVATKRKNEANREFLVLATTGSNP